MGAIANMIGLLATVSILVLSSASASIFPLGKSASKPQAQQRDAQSQSKGNCPHKWVDASFVDMGCLYFNATAALTWDDASSMCQMSSNSTLDVIANAEGTIHLWWTAGTDVGINGRWIWATTLTAVEDYVWKSGYPNAANAYNCLSLHPTYGYLGFNSNCDAAYFPICQLK